MLKPKKYKVKEPKIYTFSDVDQSLTYSYSHYLNWLFDDRVELFKGKVFRMSPAASRIHQEISGALHTLFANFLINKHCKLYAAPFDVRFPKESKADQDVFTVLQPDLCVVCDYSKLDKKGCIGSPDLVVEILSQGNNKKELHHKYKIYEEFGVKEYWVVSQQEETILIYTLIDGKFKPSKVFGTGEIASSMVLIGFETKVGDVFKDVYHQI